MKVDMDDMYASAYGVYGMGNGERLWRRGERTRRSKG